MISEHSQRLEKRSLLEQCIEALQCFPGVGPKSAQRMALHLLQRNREKGLLLAKLLERSLTEIGHCRTCQSLSEDPHCRICEDATRQKDVLCVVHSHYDMLAMEATGRFQGVYFVLHGALSPIDGIDGETLAIEKLVARLRQASFKEVILATNASAEGEITSYYIKQHITGLVPVISKLAQGVPSASQVEFLDINTLALALQERRVFGD